MRYSGRSKKASATIRSQATQALTRRYRFECDPLLHALLLRCGPTMSPSPACTRPTTALKFPRSHDVECPVVGRVKSCSQWKKSLPPFAIDAAERGAHTDRRASLPPYMFTRSAQ
eukprot:6751061-Pyramimonas_sp.AAC.1